MRFVLILLMLFLTSCSNFNKLKKDPLYVAPTALVVATMIFGVTVILIENTGKIKTRTIKTGR